MAASGALKLGKRTSSSVAIAGATPTLSLARVSSVSTDHVHLRIGTRDVVATLDPSVHPTVIERAAERGERVLVEVDGDRAVVVGALSTQPIPGIDRAERFDIEADVIQLRGNSIVMRAAGELESFAERIVTRATGVHKLVGRMLRLN